MLFSSESDKGCAIIAVVDTGLPEIKLIDDVAPFGLITSLSKDDVKPIG